MAEQKKKSLRNLRKARHGWFDYEVLDNFGDELGPLGCMVYMVLARWCYGGTRVCMSLRDMSEHARMNKDSVSKSIKKLVDLGLILEHKGKTSRSPSCFDLLDVKDLVDELKAKGIVPKISPPTVSVADSEDEGAGGEAQDASGEDAEPNPLATTGDSPVAFLFNQGGIVALNASAAPPCDDGKCLPERQLPELTQIDGFGGSTVCVDGQNCLPERTHLSATPDALINKKEEIRKGDTPLPPVPGELILPIADCVYGASQFVLCVGIAARWVMGEAGISDGRMEKKIADALELRCRLNGETLQHVAAMAARNVLEYQTCAMKGLLRIQYGWPKFFGQGHWQFPKTWALDEQKLREMQNARIGMR